LLEEIKKRLALAGEFSAHLAHEIRNPLAAISGSVQVLKGGLVLENEQKALPLIRCLGRWLGRYCCAPRPPSSHRRRRGETHERSTLGGDTPLEGSRRAEPTGDCPATRLLSQDGQESVGYGSAAQP